MDDQNLTRQSEHEQRVSQEMEGRADDPMAPGSGDPTDRMTGDSAAPSSETETEAERRGTTADEIDHEIAEDERTPLDVAYQPRTG